MTKAEKAFEIENLLGDMRNEIRNIGQSVLTMSELIGMTEDCLDEMELDDDTEEDEEDDAENHKTE